MPMSMPGMRLCASDAQSLQCRLAVLPLLCGKLPSDARRCTLPIASSYCLQFDLKWQLENATVRVMKELPDKAGFNPAQPGYLLK